MSLTNKIYYQIKPFIPRYLQILLRQRLIQLKMLRYKERWPIDKNAGGHPNDWCGWPEGKQFSLVLTHDVDTERGLNRCRRLIEIEEELGFRSSFNFVPERYNLDSYILSFVRRKGFEIGLHGLCHDGKLYQTKEIFMSRAIKINEYLQKWNAVGFRSPVMQYNLAWIHELDIQYDASTYDTAIFESESRGVGTIFPFWVCKSDNQNGYVELPYTLPQDFYLFVIMKNKNIDIWKEKLDWIAIKGGMALLNTHPDYMNFGKGKTGIEEYPYEFYIDLLRYIQKKFEGKYWHVLPNEMAKFWSQNFNKSTAVS